MTRPRIVPKSWFWSWQRTARVGGLCGVAATILSIVVHGGFVMVFLIEVVVLSTVCRKLAQYDLKSPSLTQSYAVRMLLFVVSFATGVVAAALGHMVIEWCVDTMDLLSVALFAGVCGLVVLAINHVVAAGVHYAWPCRVGDYNCDSCAYSLVGLVCDRCPECGSPTP
jgi:hypothetical protein